MCGIAGIFNFATRKPVDSHVISGMTEILKHRGPDDHGIYIDGHIGLGHRRLSIIDTSAAGHQPMCNDDASIIIVYNGESYNYRDHIPLLQSKGHRFRSSSDTEVVLRLYEEYGMDCVKMLNGMFAFAIWDSNKERLFLCRDRLGIKPLYIYEDGQRLMFASEMKSFLADPTFPRKLNNTALRDYLRFMCIPDHTAIFDGVSKLLPGQTMTVDRTGAKTQQYWDITDFKQRTDLTLATAAKEFSELFEAVVKRQMVSDVPLGTFLSGGVDSSAITAIAAQQASNPLNTFSVAFSGFIDHDESVYASLVSEKYGTNHNKLDFLPNLINTLPAIAWHADEPFAISSAFALYQLAEMASKQVKVVLSGDGADEVFAGYEHRYTPLPWRLPHKMSSLATFFPGRLGQSLQWRTTRPSHDFSSRINRYKPHQITSLLNPDFISNDSQDIVGDLYDKPTRASSLSRMLYADMKTTLAAEMLTKADRMTMAFGLETRVPFLDHTLVEWAFTLPTEFRIHKGTGKRVVKKALEPMLPHDLLYRPKHGFNVPLDIWMRNELKEWVHDLLSPEALMKRNVFEPQFVQSLLREHMADKTDNSNRLLMLIMYELWCQSYLD